MFTLSVTGHRPKYLWGYASYDPYRPLVDRIHAGIVRLARAHGGLRLVTGGAQGVDQCAFWAGLRAKQELAAEGIPVVLSLFLPFPGQDNRWGEDGPFGRRDFRRMMDTADEVLYTRSAPSRSAYLERDHAMVDASHDALEGGSLLVVTPQGGVEDSGTAATAAYAGRIGCPSIWLDPHTLKAVAR